MDEKREKYSSNSLLFSQCIEEIHLHHYCLEITDEEKMCVCSCISSMPFFNVLGYVLSPLRFLNADKMSGESNSRI